MPTQLAPPENIIQANFLSIAKGKRILFLKIDN